MEKSKKPKIIAVVGPTSSGKSSLAVLLAKKFDGEVISADSRQVYKGFNIGTGKITKKEMQGIPHHLLDVASPKHTYTVAQFKIDAEKAIKKILSKGKIPIVAGGTGFYIETLLGTISIPDVPPNKKLRARLEKQSAEILFKTLQKLDSNRARTIDQHNKHRLVRAIEIATVLGHVPPPTKKVSLYETCKIGIKTDDKKLKENITTRLFRRIKNGMIAEAKRLHENGLSFKRMEAFGLEYRYLAKYLKGEMSKNEMITKLEIEIWKYTKRQKTWFKRDRNTQWFLLAEIKKIEKTVQQFLHK